MIDEKKIEEAVIAHIKNELCPHYNSDYNNGEVGYNDLYYEGGKSFKAGINWFKENLWHPMNEEPEMGSEILIQRNMEVWRKHHPGLNIKSTFVNDLDYHDKWENYAHDDEYKRWLYIEDLLKGGE